MGLRALGILAEYATGWHAVELPATITAETIEIREHAESEGYAAAVLVDGAWYRNRCEFYAHKAPGESDADVVERLGLDEETLIPGRRPEL